MDSQTIRAALWLLQEDPENTDGWQSLQEAVEVSDGDLSADDLLHLLDAARQRHRERGEWDAVARLLELAISVAESSSPEGVTALLTELARVQGDELLAEADARKTWARLLEVNPDDAAAPTALEESQERQEKWKELVQTYAREAEGAPDEVYKSSMLMRAAEMALRYGEAADMNAVVERLEQAVRLDTNNDRAARILERIYCTGEQYEDAARVRERHADRADEPAMRVTAGVRLARLYNAKLDDQERGIRAYQRVLKDAPNHDEAKRFLSDLFSKEERWEELVKLYERELSHGDQTSSGRLGDLLQIAMLYWRNLDRAEEAEQWFEKVRKLEPAHPAMLEFYREYLAELGDDAKLLQILQSAVRAAADDEEKARIGAELARLTEGQRNAQKAIEQYKSVLRHDPDNEEAREALKRLYKQTEGYNALVELLRQQLERTDAEAYEQRLAILREVATVYRVYIKSDTALVSVLNQIVQLDDKVDAEDVSELRELVRLYEKLGRWRDLLTWQLKLAEVTPDLTEKAQLYRAAGERWLEQFTNVQNATEAYERLLELVPDDPDARQKLEQLYRKRRAWPALYSLFEGELARSEGANRISVMREMAVLAADRLNRGEDAVRLYKEILDLDPSKTEVLDALEKHAERARNWAVLAEALERRIEMLEDDKERLGVLQKLGSVYADHLEDPTQAARTWRRVLELQPGHHRALRVLRDSYLQSGDYQGLEELYESQSDFEGLAEVLSNAADRAKDSALKIELSYRAAAVYVEKLDAPDRAFRSYERVLATDPSDVRAARALIPLYETDEKWARLPALYEVLLDQSEDPADQLALLEKLVEVTGTRLSDRRAAVGYARRAYELAPTQALELLEEASRQANGWDAFVEAVAARLASSQPSATPAPEAEAEPEAGGAGKRRRRRRKDRDAAPSDTPAAEGLAADERRQLEIKLAEVYSEQLGRTDEAVAVYRGLLERDPSDSEAASAFEAILRREDRRDELRWLLDLRVTHCLSDAERIHVLVDWASLEEDVFEAPAKAIELYRRVIELDPVNDIALRALPRLLLAADDPAGAVEVIERDRDRLAGDERAAREIELAVLYLERLERHEPALSAAVRALEITSGEKRAIEVLEKLLGEEAVQARAAEVLAEQYADVNDARREAKALTVMLQHAEGQERRLELFDRLADVYELKLESFSSALDTMLAALGEFASELRLWDRADSLAGQAGRPTDLAAVFREVLRQDLPDELMASLSARAARLHEEKLGDPIGATPYLEKVLALDPGDESAFQRLKDILTGAERWGELEALYDRASQAATELSRKADMLVEVALIAEEIIEDPPKATTYYERILEIDPLHETAIRSLDRLYAQQQRDADLAGLLERRLETAVGEEVIEFKLRIARIQLEKLHEPEKAIVHVEDVLVERSNDYNARELAEKLLEIGSLRGRAARMLETVYEQRDEMRDLVRVLAIRLEEMGATLAAAEEAGEEPEVGLADERRELLRRVAMLRDDRLHDDEGAFAVLSDLVPQDPDDADARARLIDIGKRMGVHEKVAEVLTASAGVASTPALQGEILSNVAAIYEDLLQDTARAEQTYRRVLTLDETDADLVLPAARALERIYLAGAEHSQLAEMLRIQVRLEQDGEARSRLLGRLGELCENVLGDHVGAIEAWRSRADDTPGDAEALAALDGLYEKSERWRELVEVLERRRDATEVPDERRRLLTRAAVIQAERLENVAEAIEGWRAVADEFGPDEESLQALEQLFQRAERWDELADTLERHLDVADTDQQRLGLFVRLGNLRRDHLSDTAGALESYRNALALDTAHGPSREALEKLLGSEDHLARREAAEILHPIYEADGDHARLLRVLEIEFDTADDPDAQLGGLEKAIDVADVALSDQERAFQYAQRALRVAVGHTDLAPWLAHVERLAGATNRQADYVKLLCEIVPEIFDGEVQAEVTLRIADLARERLQDRGLAREYYSKALELRSDDPKALMALESLYEESGDAPNLLHILERRVEIAAGDQDRKELLFRRARLLAEVLNDKPRAIEVYEEILDLALDSDALVALESLYTEEERWADLVSLYERQLEAGPRDPAHLHVKIATVAARNQLDVLRAFDELERALELERQNEAAISELERLLASAGETEHRARAATLLEPVYLVRADYDRVMETLRARLEYSQEPDERRELLQRLAQLYEEQKEDYKQALETTAQLLHEDISDEASLAEVERLAKVAGAERRLAEIYAKELEEIVTDDEASVRLARRTGEIFTELEELDRALVFLRRALAFEPENTALFSAIDAILERTNQHEARVELYRQALDHRYEPEERLRIFHTVAALYRNKLSQPDEAIETYRSALDVDETDAAALDALTDLYRERERWDDLSDLYLRRAESAGNPEAGAPYRLALSRLLREQLNEPERAIDQLDEIVREVPTHAQAVKDLESLLGDEAHKERVVEILRPLYEQQDDWRHTIRLNEERFALAEDVAEKVQVLRETASLWEERGSDLERARRALRAAVELDPDDAEVRQEFERLAAATEAWAKLASTYDQVLSDHPDIASKRDILAVLADVCDQRLDDPRRALGAFERLHEADQSELEPLEKMEQLAMLLSDWQVVVRALTAKAELVLDDEQRASVWRQIGEAKRDMLDNLDGAVEAYEQAVELDPQSAFTMDCLLELYEAKGDAAHLVELYPRRVELCEDDDDLRYELLTKAARVYEEQLTDRLQAIDMLNQALGVKAGDAAVLDSLNRLYRAEAMWPELLDNLRLQAGTTETVAERARLRREMGATLADKLQSYDDALDAYRLVLDEAPDDVETVAAVRTIAQDHDDLRETVAEILVPVLRSVNKHAELVEVLEMRLTVESEPMQRCDTLRTIADVLEHQLDQPVEAQQALLRALSERPDDEELHNEIQRLAGASEGWGRYADALSERGGATFDPDIAKELFTRLGRVAEEHLDDEPRAIEAYSKAVEQAGDEPELLAALDRLYTKAGNSSALSEVLERRAAIETEDPTVAELSYRLAVLQVRDFEELGRGLASLRAALERDPNHEAAAEELEKLTEHRDLFEEAADVLEEVYRNRGRTDRLAAIYEKRVGFADSAGERIDMRRNLARVLEDECSDPAAAQRVLQQGLVDDPADGGLHDELERLAPITGDWKSAADALAEAIEKSPDLVAEVARELCVKVATWRRDRIEDREGAEQALVRALEFEPNSDDVLALLEELQMALGRERDLVATLRRRARLGVDDLQREDLYQRAKQLADQLEDAKLAEEIVRELLEHDDTSLWALSELTVMREAAEDYAETFALLVKRSELRAGGDIVEELRHKAAAIARDKLAKKLEAIELYEALFESEPEDAVASSALRELYAETERWDDLVRLLERLVDLSDAKSEQCALRVELARMNATRYQAHDTAIDLLRTVLDDEPGHADAVVALSELLETTSRDEELAELLSSQIEAARAREDVDAELKFLVRLAEICETRLNDRERAIETYRGVVERQQDHRDALSALARLYQAADQNAEAAEVLDQLLQMSEGEPAIELASTLADVFGKLDDGERAARALERGLVVDERHADLRQRLQALYSAQEAWEKLANMVAQDAEFSEDTKEKTRLLREAADIHATRRQDQGAAAELLEKASELVPDDRELLLQLCDAYSASGRGRDAAGVLEKIVESYGTKRSKELGEIHRRLANAYLAQDETEKALGELDKAFRIEPGNVHVLKQLGQVALETGDLKKAQQMFRALLLQRLDANSPITKPEVFFYLGEVHGKLGETPKAKQMYERALQADPGMDMAKERLEALK